MRLSSFQLLPNESRERLNLRRNQIALLVLRVDKQHVRRVLPSIPVVDHPNPATLPTARRAPPQLSKPARSADQRPLFRPKSQGELQCPIRLIIQKSAEPRGEHGRLDKAHGQLYPIDLPPSPTRRSSDLEFGGLTACGSAATAAKPT